MILVDTSVWIDLLRLTDSRQTRMLRDPTRQNQMKVGDVILLEVLQGARSAQHAAGLEHMLREFPIVDLLGDAIALAAVQHFRTLRALGVTIRRTTDLIIGTWCIANNARLLHNDRDFDQMQRHLGLMVA